MKPLWFPAEGGQKSAVGFFSALRAAHGCQLVLEMKSTPSSGRLPSALSQGFYCKLTTVTLEYQITIVVYKSPLFADI